jgi:hypothetical protein
VADSNPLGHPFRVWAGWAGGLMRSAYAQVDHRMLSLEAFKARKDRDPIEVIREHYGKTKPSG